MMLLLVHIVCVLCLLTIALQDIKERKVLFWLFISAGLAMSYLYLSKSIGSIYVANITVNILAVGLIAILLYFYTKIKLRKKLSSVIGIGDFIFFLIIALSFPIPTFIVLFSFSLIFSLLSFLLLKRRIKNTSVPLAGLQAVFFLIVFSCNWVFQIVDLYNI